MSTKRSTPNSTATSAVTRVASTLLRTDSTGFASISGTCLNAAAWKTTSGRYRSNTCRSLARLPTSASTGTLAGNSRPWTSSRSISNNEVSA
jgi:hypothetical protein